mgnify:CR=1 FL=1
MPPAGRRRGGGAPRRRLGGEPPELARRNRHDRTTARSRSSGFLDGRPGDFDAVVVGYPGHFDLTAARRAARGRPVVFNPLVSLADTFVADRGRFRRRLTAGSSAAKRSIAMRSGRPTSSSADTRANANHLAELADLRPESVEVAFVGAEERIFQPGWAADEPFTALFVGKLIPLHGVETILAAARAAPELRFRIVGSGQLDSLLERTAAPTWSGSAWVEYEQLPQELHRAGVRARNLRDLRQGAAGDPEQGLPGTRLRHAARHGRYPGCSRAARTRTQRSLVPPGTRRRWRMRCSGLQPIPSSRVASRAVVERPTRAQASEQCPRHAMACTARAGPESS